MRVMIKDESRNCYMLSKSLEGAEVGQALTILSNMECVDHNYVGNKYVYQKVDDRKPELIIIPDGSDLFNENQPEVLFEINKKLQETNQKQWYENYQLQNKNKELEKELANIREALAPKDVPMPPCTDGGLGL